MAKTFTSPAHAQSRTFEVGSKLRRRREGRGESLEQVAAATRISPDYLDALEQDAPVSAFPAPVYARAFLRSYARHLGLNEDSLTAAFAVRHGAMDPPPRAVVPLEEPPSERRLPSLRGLPGLGDITASVAAALRPGTRNGHRVRGDGLSSNGELAGARILVDRRPSGNGDGSHVPVVISSNGGSSHRASTHSRTRRRRLTPRGSRLALAAIVAVPIVALLVRSDFIFGGKAQPVATSKPKPAPVVGPELPRGGRVIFPNFRVVAYYGAARTTTLGVLGEGPTEAARQLLRQAQAYDRPARPVLPAFELIGTLATASPGQGAKYRVRMSDSVIGGYLDAARANKMLFVIDVQPGRADFFSEVKAWEKYLLDPDVGLALDPEWHVGPGQLPGREIGSVDAASINRIGDWLAGIVRKNHLPQKLFIIHQFMPDMIVNKAAVKSWPQLATVFDIDGYGSQETKLSRWRALTAGDKEGTHHGIKLFYDQDPDLMSPKDVFRLRPKIDFIVYQ
jgi:transcriptional regulator with XRE-family HTH domain